MHVVLPDNASIRARFGGKHFREAKAGLKLAPLIAARAVSRGVQQVLLTPVGRWNTSRHAKYRLLEVLLSYTTQPILPWATYIRGAHVGRLWSWQHHSAYLTALQRSRAVRLRLRLRCKCHRRRAGSSFAGLFKSRRPYLVFGRQLRGIPPCGAMLFSWTSLTMISTSLTTAWTSS
jgi:hypothetical protein